MKIMKKLIACLLVVAPIGITTAQIEVSGGPINNPSPNVIDGVYIQQHIPTKKMIPYEHVREADVIWSSRVWRAIDLREKINLPMYYPLDDLGSGTWVKNATRWSLWTVIRTHILNADLTVYDPENELCLACEPDGDQFKYPVVPAPGKNYYTDEDFRTSVFRMMGTLAPQNLTPLTGVDGEDSIVYYDDGSFEVVLPPRDTIWFTSADIIQYRIKEDWFFDKERSVMDVRILGLCPVVYKKDENGNISGLRELFWLYFPQCRFVFNNYFVYNTKNDAQWFSFDDLFWKRQFSSTIYKESNVYDRKVEAYKAGIDALYESQRITESIRIIEHDVWDL
jgi:gliding motility associated protien GldN